ncbi:MULTISPECIES: Imm61 family immunity protein [unclassified Mycobacterium]|uniref:Imm61 family immunity protein n=1 Tax=unclassified Mycobacterium TaxID=2642494 RepID=UPI000FA8487E|nr:MULTISPECIES: Imm61 family immunity protein [unclassified Mycobacterium]MDP7705239.1 Imm61 family immunity protein [Mycobacterium sp. TY815]MDP7723534.1 Imm61 family immunity protein [Mycobacterium sp. TY814]RUP02449.1 MAG: hypothetical protein EKK34_23915 [Mycobacterium sp.]
MGHDIEISSTLQRWARLAGYTLTPGPVTDDGRAIFYNSGGEVRYFVGLRSDGWFTVTESDRMSAEYFVLAARTLDVIEKYFFGVFGSTWRGIRGLPDVRLPASADDIGDGFTLADVEFDGRQCRGLVDPAGGVVAISSGDAFSGTWELAPLWLYLKASADEIMRSFEDPAGRPLFAEDGERGFLAGVAQAFEDAGGSSLASGFTIVDDAPGDPDVARRDEQIRAQASTMLDPVAQELAYLGPPGWQQYRAAFALTVRAGVAQLEFTTPDGVQPSRIPEPIVEMVRRQREFTARMSAGPWWRLIMTVTSQGRMSVSYDYGDEPFPADQLQPAQNYRDDIAAFPRPRLPVWLAGYLAGPTAQGRTPQQAAEAAAADETAGRIATKTDDIEPLQDTWTRWAVLAAVHVGARSAWGPRIFPGLAWYESDARSGSTLYVLPGDRAVLSGGRWDSRLLADAYENRRPLPDLYAGAPAWVNDSVLNTRNQNGLLSFCYWHFDRQWYRGAADTFDELDAPLPPIWTPQETVMAMLDFTGPDTQNACHELLHAAAGHSATRRHLAAVFSNVADADLDAAFNQLSLAGLTTS